MSSGELGSSELYLGLDFGTESVRAVLVGPDGEVSANASAPYASGQIVRGAPAASRFGDPLPAEWALQDPADWLSASAVAVRDACAAAGTTDVRGVGVAFTSCTMLPALRDGTPLSRTPLAHRPHAWPKLWKHHGPRGQAERMTEVARKLDEPWLARYGGIVGLEWLFPKILEVVEDDADVAAAAEVWVEGGDWLVWQLTGAPALGGDRDGDGVVRSTCQAGYKALWSQRDGYPSPDYLAACGPGLATAAAESLPGTFAPPGSCAGVLSGAAAALLGLAPDIPVSAAVIDAHAAVPGVGVGDPGTLVMVLGTSGCHMVMDADEHLVAGVAGVVADGILPGLYGYETGQAAVGDAFDWVRRLCATDHSTLEERARAVPAGSDGLVALDWFNGCRTPLMDGGLRGAVLGIGLHHGPGHLYRAVAEASACGLVWVVETLREGGVAVDRFVATGGVAHRNPLFTEIVASALDAPVEVPAVSDATAVGAAVLGALAAGRFPDAATAVRQMAASASAATNIVDPAEAATYRGVYARYREAARSHAHQEVP